VCLYSIAAPTLINHCLFNENKADKYGGAIYKNSKNIDLNVIYCEFTGNSGVHGGGIFLNGPYHGYSCLKPY
jgi:predicted outer membrane repeat protein